MIERRKIEKAVAKMLKVNMGLKGGEKLLVVTDSPTIEERTTKNGKVVEIDGGGEVGKRFRELLAFGKEEQPYLSRRNYAELGIGTNPKAKRPDNVFGAEKIRGTVHVAMGDNSHMGGAVRTDIHEDFVIPSATLTFDNRLVMRNGKLLV